MLPSNSTHEREILMSLVNQGSQPASVPLKFGRQKYKRTLKEPRTASPWMWRRFFVVVLVVLYCVGHLWVETVGGIKDVWGM